MRIKILSLIFSLLFSQLSVVVQASEIDNLINRASPTYQAFETHFCDSELLNDELVDSDVIDTMCKVLVKSDFCEDVEPEYKKDCLNQKEFDLIDTAISCLEGVFDSLKDLWEFLKTLVGLIVSEEEREKLGAEAKVFLESLSTYYEAEKIKAKKDMWGWGKDVRAGLVAGKNTIGYVVKKFILEPLSETYEKLACQNSDGKTKTICNLVSDVFLPPVALLAAFKKGPKVLKALVKRKTEKKTVVKDTNLEGDTVPVTRVRKRPPQTNGTSPTVEATRKLNRNGGSTVELTRKMNPKGGSTVPMRGRAAKAADSKYVRTYEFGEVKFHESKPYRGDETGKFYPAESVELNSNLQPLSQRGYSVEEMKLKSSEVAELNTLGGGITDTFIVKFKDGSKAVFKPEDRHHWASNYRTEVLAYQIDRQFGFGLVPPTVEKVFKTPKGNLRKGSLQRFKAGEMATDVSRGDINIQDLNKQKVMDFLIDHRDRHGGNFLVNTNGKISSIDNGLSFTGRGFNYTEVDMMEESLVKFMTTTEGQKIMNRIKKTNRERLRVGMKDYIGDVDTNRFFNRMDFLIKYYDQLME